MRFRFRLLEKWTSPKAAVDGWKSVCSGFRFRLQEKWSHGFDSASVCRKNGFTDGIPFSDCKKKLVLRWNSAPDCKKSCAPSPDASTAKVEFMIDTGLQDRGWGHEMSRQNDPGRQRRQLLVVILNRVRVISQNLRLIIGLVVALYAP